VLLEAYMQTAADVYISLFPADVILKHSNAIDKAVEVSSRAQDISLQGLSM
jgi:hypothetical protein